MELYKYSGTLVPKVKMSGRKDFHLPMVEEFGKRFKDYRDNWDEAETCEYLPEFPLFIDVEPEYRCNLRCSTCTFSIPDHPNLMDDRMSINTFDRICTEGERYNLPSISVSNNNEGLLEKYLFEYIDIARKHNIMDIFLGTNALLLNTKVIDQIIDSGLTRLLVSIDAASPETYFNARNSKCYDKVVSNCEEFIKRRNRKNKKLPLLRVSLVKTSINEHEVDEFKDFWNLKADIVSIQDYIPTKQKYEENISLLPSDRVPFPEHFIPQKSKKICSALWQRFSIRANGDIFACCHMKYELKVGNINEISLYDAWHSEFMRGLRSVHKAGMYQCLNLCSTCL